MRRSFLIFLLVLSSLACSTLRAQVSPFFPRTGERAVAQLVREIKNPSVYLVIASAPGLEDLSSIAYLRVGTGAKVAVAFITNGEDIPSDLNGETFYLLASRRKEEAYHALSNLGVESFFLNIPSDEFPVAGEFFHASDELDDTLTARLDSVVSQLKPDVILLDRSPLSLNEKSEGFNHIEGLIKKNLEAGKGSRLWEVRQLFAENGDSKNAVNIPVEARDQIWSQSYASMAEETQKYYGSLKYQIPLWRNLESHRYVQVYPTFSDLASKRSHSRSGLLAGTGTLEMGKRLKELLPAIESATSIGRIRGREKQLTLLHDGIARVDVFISRYSDSLTQRDLRILATWKLRLEKIRCAILGVDIPYSVSDTVVTPIQLFFLKLARLNAEFRKGETQILFPGVIQKQWIVNETQKEFYEWKDSTQFRVLTPRSISLNSPESPEGFEALQVRTPFTFMVMHRDPNPDYDFLYREDVPLIISPYRSIQVLTPQVAMCHDANIIVRFRSNVRDRSGGEFLVDDSLVALPKERVELPGKNYIVTDTLPLKWKETASSAPRRVQIVASDGTDIGGFVIHPFRVEAKVSKRVGFFSTIDNSPLKIALSRLGIGMEELDTVRINSQGLSRYSTIVLDQFAFGKFSGSSSRLEVLRSWVESGGQLLVLPQYGTELHDLTTDGQLEFSYLPIMSPVEKVIVDSTTNVFRFPNRVSGGDLSGGDFPISFGGINGLSDGKGRTLMATQSGTPLVVEETVGHGTVIFCALNLYPRFLAVDEAAYKLLADLISE